MTRRCVFGPAAAGARERISDDAGVPAGPVFLRESGGSEIAAREGASAGHDGRRGIGPSAWQHHHVGTDPDPAIEVLDVLVGQTNAARGHELADGRWLVGAVDAIKRVAEIERTRAERIAPSPCHHSRQVGLSLDHFARRRPIRPLTHLADFLGTRPGEAFAADTDAVAQRLAASEDEIEEPVRVLIAIELSKRSWIVAVNTPLSEKISNHMVKGWKELLELWFRARVGTLKGPIRRITIVAVARKIW